MSRSLHPRAFQPGLIVLLAADPPPPDGRGGAEPPAARHEALVALARAVFAVGGQIVLPADADIALVIGTVALDYAQPPVAERRAEATPSPLIVMETGAVQHSARALLAPLASRGALSYVDAGGAAVLLDPGAPSGRELPEHDEEGSRQRVTHGMVQAMRPTAAVLISPGRSALLDLGILREHDVPTVIFRDGILEEGIAMEFGGTEDPMQRLLPEASEGRWSRSLREPEPGQSRPYAYLMQRLVAEWTGRG
ncbi:MAG TPA: hypothetical protein VMV92_44070 [Streptosporangiaceae bacterium]|nr:hypothetical protein [Streptosporangiaceae bacterium]